MGAAIRTMVSGNIYRLMVQRGLRLLLAAKGARGVLTLSEVERAAKIKPHAGQEYWQLEWMSLEDQPTCARDHSWMKLLKSLHLPRIANFATGQVEQWLVWTAVQAAEMEAEPGPRQGLIE
jgi:hypothetical protein